MRQPPGPRRPGHPHVVRSYSADARVSSSDLRPDSTPSPTAPQRRWAGLHRTGLHRTGLHRTGLHRTGLRRSGLGRTGLGRTGLDRPGLRTAGSPPDGSPPAGSRPDGSPPAGSRRSGLGRSGLGRSGLSRTGLGRLHVGEGHSVGTRSGDDLAGTVGGDHRIDGTGGRRWHLVTVRRRKRRRERSDTFAGPAIDRPPQREDPSRLIGSAPPTPHGGDTRRGTLQAQHLDRRPVVGRGHADDDGSTRTDQSACCVDRTDGVEVTDATSYRGVDVGVLTRFVGAVHGHPPRARSRAQLERDGHRPHRLGSTIDTRSPPASPSRAVQSRRMTSTSAVGRTLEPITVSADAVGVRCGCRAGRQRRNDSRGRDHRGAEQPEPSSLHVAGASRSGGAG